MTTFTAWKFDTPGGAQAAREQLDLARAEGLVKVIDRAVLEWPEGAEKPSLRHSRDDEWRGTGWGAFWGLLVGTLFFVPMLGAVAIGAGAGLLLALAGAQALRRLPVSPFYGVSPEDPIALSGALLLLLGSALAAVLIPARRATRINPAQVLKSE